MKRLLIYVLMCLLPTIGGYECVYCKTYTNSKTYTQKSKNKQTKKKLSKKQQEREKELRKQITLELTPEIEKRVRAELTPKIQREIEQSYKKQKDSVKVDTILYSKAINHQDILTINYSFAKTKDEYLSQHPFKGYTIGIRNEWWQKFRKSEAWGHVGTVAVSYSNQHIYNYYNSITAVGINAGWGAYSIYKNNIFTLNFGPYISADTYIKTLSSNVNKPVSVDLGLDLNTMLSMSIRFGGKKTSYRLQYLNYFNLIGVQFEPHYWQAYYKIEENLKDNIYFSSFNNRIYLRHELMFDMQFLHSTWRIGGRHEYLNYGTADTRFQRQELSIVIGTIFNYKIDGRVRLYGK